MKQKTEEFKEKLSSLLQEAFDKAISEYDFFAITEEDEEPILMVPEEIKVYDKGTHMGINNGQSQILAYFDDSNQWYVVGAEYTPKRYKLVPTTFGKLNMGDILFDGEKDDVANLNLSDYGIKTREDAYHYWSMDKRNTEVCSVSEIKSDTPVYKVITIED